MIKHDNNLIPHDTTPEAARVQTEIYKNMTGEQRLEIAFKLSNNLRQIVRDGIRHRHPDYTDDMITQAYLTLIMDDTEFVKEAFGGREVQP
ncbi:MAG: hypothetical protein FVQ82_04870 [Planctomycetes bacterium]|nr:hypothetical protein [Planctomycetota bacterium]